MRASIGFGADRFQTRALTGLEANLGLYKRVEADAMSAEVDASFNMIGGFKLSDNSSSIRVGYRPSGWVVGEGLTVEAFPFRSDRLRLGFDALASRGDAFYSPRAEGLVPALEVKLAYGPWYAIAGAKTVVMHNPLTMEDNRFVLPLAGAGWHVLPEFDVEAIAAYLPRGLSPGLASQGLSVEVNGSGAAARITYHHGVAIGPRVDLVRYAYEPDRFDRLFVREEYPLGVSTRAHFEVTALEHTLEAQEAFGTTRQQTALAAILGGELKVGQARAYVEGRYRSLSFIQFDVPGFPPFKDFPTNSSNRPETVVAVAFDYAFPSVHLTPGLAGSLVVPAAYQDAPVTLGGSTTRPREVAVMDTSSFSILPTGASVQPIITGKATVRWDTTHAGVAAELAVTRNPNLTTYTNDAYGMFEPAFGDPTIVSFRAVLQVRL